MEIVDYDSTHYDYTKYWAGREYEDAVEKIALAKLLPPTGGSLIDVGGGFGRLLKEYVGKYQKLTLLDFSQENLDKAASLLRAHHDAPLQLTKGDVYNLPFANQTFDAGFMIRVMHHLEDPAKALGEIYRVMKPNSVFVLEFANKCHLKSRLKYGLNFCQDETPFNQLTKGSGVFLNFHPQQIIKIVAGLGWYVDTVLSVSNFRSPFLKRVLPTSLLIKLDDGCQKLFAKWYLGPSIFLKLTKSR